MATKKKKPVAIPAAVLRKAVREYQAKQARKIAPLGGVARWEGVPPEERSRLNTAASKLAAAARTAKAQKRREVAAMRAAAKALRAKRKG